MERVRSEHALVCCSKTRLHALALELHLFGDSLKLLLASLDSPPKCVLHLFEKLYELF